MESETEHFFTHPDQEKLGSTLSDYGVEKCNLLGTLSDLSEQSEWHDFIILLYMEDWKATHGG